MADYRDCGPSHLMQDTERDGNPVDRQLQHQLMVDHQSQRQRSRTSVYDMILPPLKDVISPEYLTGRRVRDTDTVPLSVGRGVNTGSNTIDTLSANTDYIGNFAPQAIPFPSTSLRAANDRLPGQMAPTDRSRPVQDLSAFYNGHLDGHGVGHSPRDAVRISPRLSGSEFPSSNTLMGPGLPTEFFQTCPSFNPSDSGIQAKYQGVRHFPGRGAFHVYEGGYCIPTHVDGQSVNPTWGLTKAYRPRKRLSIACHACRKKKIRCEPGIHGCVQCKKANQVCRPSGPQRQSPQRSISAASSVSDGLYMYHVQEPGLGHLGRSFQASNHTDGV